MKKFSFRLAIILSVIPGCLQNSFAQVQATITGKIIDAETREAIPFSTVSLFSSDSVLITGGVATVSGEFSISVSSGEYFAQIQAVSYKTKKIALRSYAGVINLGTIQLEQDVKTLEEVLVSGQRPLMQMDLDKRVFNVSEDLSNVGRNAVEILDNLPSITVSQDGGVSLRGSQNVRILIDGKPSGLAGISSTDALQALQGSMIERIEVVTNPSVRYEAEGNAGVINIILKKEKQKGVNAVIEGTVGHPFNSSLSTTMNFRREKINYFLNYSVNYRERPGRASIYQRFSPTDKDTVFYTRSYRDFLRTGWSQNFRIGADLSLNSNNIITAAVLLNVGDNTNYTGITYKDYDVNNQLGRNLLRNDREQEDEKNMEYTLSYEKLFKQDGRKLVLYSQYRDNVESEISAIKQRAILDLFPDPDNDLNILQRSDNAESEKNTLLQADYIHPFKGGKGKFEAGYRGTFRKIETNYIVEEFENGIDWVSLPEFTNTFQYDENIQALYALTGNHVGKISYELGLRVEQTEIRTELLEADNLFDYDRIFNKSYLNFFPSVHTNYHINDNNSIQLSYSRRISRPGFGSLNPFSSFSDARNIRAGNPDLNPEFTDSYETGYLANGESYSLYGGIYYRHTTDISERINFVVDTVTYSRPVNLSVENSYGVELNATKDFTKWWSINASANFFRSITDGEFEGRSYDRDTYTWNSRFSNRFALGKRTNIQGTLFYRAPQRTTQGRSESFYTVDLGLTRDLWKNKATLSINVRDLFNSRIFRSVNEGDEFYFKNRFQRSFTQVVVSLVFRINQNKIADEDEDRDNNIDQDFD
jgi:outer membrane receptor protein involved in Fe transport